MDNSLQDVKAVLFDFDETLIDAIEGLEAAHGAIAGKLCDYFSSEASGLSSKDISEKLSDFDDRMNFERRYDRDLWWPGFIDELGIRGDLSRSQIEGLTKIYWEAYAEAAGPYPSTSSTLKYLDEKGYVLGIVTDTDGSGIPKRERISRFDFSNFFDVIVVGGDDTPRSKPDPGPFELAASDLGMEPGECVMVGDKPFTDIRGAKSVGMRTILLKRRDWGVEENPDFTVESLDDLKELL